MATETASSVRRRQPRCLARRTPERIGGRPHLSVSIWSCDHKSPTTFVIEKPDQLPAKSLKGLSPRYSAGTYAIWQVVLPSARLAIFPAWKDRKRSQPTKANRGEQGRGVVPRSGRPPMVQRPGTQGRAALQAKRYSWVRKPSRHRNSCRRPVNSTVFSDVLSNHRLLGASSNHRLLRCPRQLGLTIGRRR